MSHEENIQFSGSHRSPPSEKANEKKKGKSTGPDLGRPALKPSCHPSPHKMTSTTYKKLFLEGKPNPSSYSGWKSKVSDPSLIFLPEPTESHLSYSMLLSRRERAQLSASEARKGRVVKLIHVISLQRNKSRWSHLWSELRDVVSSALDLCPADTALPQVKANCQPLCLQAPPGLLGEGQGQAPATLQSLPAK